MAIPTSRSLAFSDFEFRATEGNSLNFSGYASKFDGAYSMGWYSESVARGAFTKTLSENPDVRLLLNHDGLPLARTKSGTLKLSQDQTGLYTEANLDASDPDVQRIRSKMERGDLDQMSFAFRVVKDTWSPDYTSRSLNEVSLANGDVSLVTYPANPDTSAAIRALRSAAQDNPEAIRSLYAELEERAGAKLSKQSTDTLRGVLEHLSSIDNAQSSAASDLNDLLNTGSVPEPEETNSAPHGMDADTAVLLRAATELRIRLSKATRR